jgi:branched-subunit amino acid aminotransferase/4-amino-4-deoxychorismate lyase
MNGAVPESRRIFRYGDGVFITLAVEEGLVLDANLQLARLFAAAEAVGLERPAGFETAGAARLATEELASDLCTGRERAILRLQWHAAGDSRGFGRVSADSEVLAEAMPAPVPRRPTVAILEDGSVPLPSVPRHKTCSALANILCAQEAQRLGTDEAVRVDSGVLLEASSANVLWLVGRELFTPSATLPLYAGSVRQRVIEGAPAAGLEVCEGEFAPGILETAEAVLLVNAARGVECAREVDGRSLGPVPDTVVELTEEVARRRRDPDAGA